MRDGTQFVDTFLKEEDKWVWLQQRGQLRKNKISTISVYKPLPHEMRGNGERGN